MPQQQHAQKPMVDFFTSFIPHHILPRHVMSRGSQHAKYFQELAGFEDFMVDEDLYDTDDIKEHILSRCDKIKRIEGGAKKNGASFVHFYPQVYDTRIYRHAITSKGWCLGVCAHWIKQKQKGIDIFPDAIYTNPELAMDRGAPIALMKNQDKLMQNEALLKAAMGGMDLRVKNALDYIAGGRAAKIPPVLKANNQLLKASGPSLQSRLLGKLAGRNAPLSDRQKDYFLVFMDGMGGGGHVIAFDFYGIELFDPTFGVIRSTTGSRLNLAKFFFNGYLGVAYDNFIDKVQFYRAPKP